MPRLRVEAPLEDPKGHRPLRRFGRAGCRAWGPLAPPGNGRDEVQTLGEDLRAFWMFLGDQLPNIYEISMKGKTHVDFEMKMG